MSLQLASEIWNLVSESIPFDEREQIAFNFVGILVDNEYDLDDIQYEFSDDDNLITAVKYYRDEYEEEDEEEENEYEDESDDY